MSYSRFREIDRTTPFSKYKNDYSTQDRTCEKILAKESKGPFNVPLIDAYFSLQQGKGGRRQLYNVFTNYSYSGYVGINMRNIFSNIRPYALNLVDRCEDL